MTDENGNHWLVYMIRADDDSLYTGITTDLRRRWQQHSALLRGGAKFFRGRKPSALVYVESGHDRSSAARREAAIKRLARTAKELLLMAATNDLPKMAGWGATGRALDGDIWEIKNAPSGVDGA